MSFVPKLGFPYISGIYTLSNPGTWNSRDRSEMNMEMSRSDHNTMTSSVYSGDFGAAAAHLFGAVIEFPAKTIARLYSWQARLEERQHLRDLSDAQLQDVGLTRQSANAEANKSLLIP